MIQNFDIKRLDNIVIEDVNPDDYPDFSDAFIASADYNGIPLDENQLEWVTDQCPELVSEKALDSLI